jgi:hypothetical protein
VQRHLSPETVETIREANRFTWIPVSLDIEVTEAVHEETGEDGLMDWAKEGFLHAMKTPVLGPMFSGIVRLFGIQPAGMFKLAPLAWRAAYRNCGELTVQEVSGVGLRGALDDLPPHVAECRPYFIGVAGVFDAVLHLSQHEGKVILKNLSPRRRRAEFLLLSSG